MKNDPILIADHFFFEKSAFLEFFWPKIGDPDQNTMPIPITQNTIADPDRQLKNDRDPDLRSQNHDRDRRSLILG